jgi:acyl carrier protein
MIKDRLKAIMAEVFEINVSDIKDDASQKTMDVWDSLQHLNLMVEIEDQFDLEFAPEDIGEMTTLEKIIQNIEKFQA